MDNIEDILRALAEEDDSPQSDRTEDNKEDNGGLFSGIDLGSMAKIAGLLSASGKSGDDERLLLALKPLLREENRGKIDTAVRMMKLLSLLPLLKDIDLFGQGG